MIMFEQYSERGFSTPQHATIGSGKFLDDIDYLCAMPAAKEILEGTYVYPLGMDKHTHLLLEEAARLFKKYCGM